MRNNFVLSHFIFILAIIVLLSSCKKEETYGPYEFVEKQTRGIFKMDISSAQISEQYGDKDWVMLSESELHDYFIRLKGINFRKLNENTLLIDDYSFSQKVDLIKLDGCYYFGVIYELPGDDENYVSPVLITFFGTITGNKLVATYSTTVNYYNVGQYQEYSFHASFAFETTLNWIDENQWEPAGPPIGYISDLGFDRGIRLYFTPNSDDIVPVKEYHVYRIDDISGDLDYQQIGTIENTNQYGYSFNDVTDWALNAPDLSMPGYMITSFGVNGIESFLTQQSFKAILLKR